MSRSRLTRFRRTVTAFAALALAAGGLLATGTPASAALPVTIAASTARTYLSELTVADESHASTYERSLFPTWITISGTCDTRETIIERDGTGVVTNSACTATSGKWTSPYDGVTTTDASTFDIDHLVPLSEAWDSGAWAWTTAQRQAYANDVTRPQLLAVSASSNRSKGDDDPAEWLPQTSYQCTYARAWVQVKHYYGLTVDSAEKSALYGVLDNC
ncbi:HNH endonuclease family protein [Streptantibioticus silvisoli]|uniref:HNH endonuclease family protein n=1 Tax=Streptantibioticus silvisoli TaxID=2705255 RepID=A0ABT6W2P3_9ACTN|nr:HNH endonuclease family protein [Streptantibioticus silvisoli]MDI5963771.1 HNH endonuclease family protein [Streptantibioticus silvisoli]